MEYTEEVIKEADSVVVKYMSQFHPVVINNHVSKLCITFAIQDRQSVLEFAKSLIGKVGLSEELHIKNVEIQSLTQQIEYLKSKL